MDTNKKSSSTNRVNSTNKSNVERRTMMKRMKQVIAGVLAALMMTQFAVPTFAAETETGMAKAAIHTEVNTNRAGRYNVNAAAYKYGGLDYSPVFDATYYFNKYPDIKKAFGTDAAKAFNHFITYGINEGRQACAAFNVTYYKANYADLRNAFGSDSMSYVRHYLQYGIKEKRVANKLIAGAQTTSQEEALANELFNAMNAERKARGLKALTRNTQLASAAAVRAKEASSYWSHTRPNGTSYKTVSSAIAAENLAKGFTSGAAVSTAWVNHAGHKETMLGAYTKVGIGVYKLNGVYCYAAEFGY